MNKSLYIEIANNIEKKINEGIYKRGDKLPSERELTNEYHVSRNVIRQALTLIREKGLIVVKSASGSYVTELQDDIVSSSLKRVANKYKTTIEDILEVREDLEISIIKKVVNQAGKVDIEEIKSAFQKMENAKSNINEFLKEDLNFHITLANATQNHFYTILIRSFFEMTENAIFNITLLANNSIDVTDTLQQQHWNLVEAIEKRDENLAVSFMKEHMNISKEEIKLLEGKMSE